MLEQVSAAFDACKESMVGALNQQQSAIVTFMAEVRQEIAGQNQQIQMLTEAARAKDLELQKLRLEVKASEEKARICGILDQAEIKGFDADLTRMKTFLAKKFPDQKDMAVQTDPEMDEDREYRTKMEVLARETLHAVYGKVIASLKLEEEKREEDRQTAEHNQRTAETYEQQGDRGRYQGYAARRPQASHISFWKCCLRYGLDIRSFRTFARQDLQGHIGEGEVFEVSEEIQFKDGAGFFLRLADGRGWAFSNSRKLGTCCVRAQASGSDPCADNGAGCNGWNGWRDGQPSSNHGGNGWDWKSETQPGENDGRYGVNDGGEGWNNENDAGQWQASAWNTPSWGERPASSDGWRDWSAKAPEAWKTQAESLRDEVKKRERELREEVEQAPEVPLRPAAFWLSAGRRLEEVIREAEQDSEERVSDNHLLKEQVASAKQALSGNHTFESADKKRLAQLQRAKAHQSCVLRIICPDKSVLQVHFRSAEKGEKVLEAIKPLFSDAVQASRWYVYRSPPMERMNPKASLSASGLAPGAVMYLGFDGEKCGPPFLQADLVDQLGPCREEIGVTAPSSFTGEAMGWGAGHRLGTTSTAAAAAAAESTPSAPAKAQKIEGEAMKPE
eukprot:s50_g71.t1